MKRLLSLVMVAGMVLAVTLLTGGTTEAGRPISVRIRLPVAAKLDTTGIRRILVGGFLYNDSPHLNPEQEMVELLREELEKHTTFLILEDPAPSLPEQRLEDLKQNALFFQAMGEEYRADLIISGQVTFAAVDRSGFVTQEYISPMTGRRSIRSVYVDRTGYTLRLDLIYMRGADGMLLYDTSFFQDEIVLTDESDPLSIFFILSERFNDGFLGILLPQIRTEVRYLLND
jgi:hypothetical protein